DPNLRAEGRLGERDREVVNQVVALALEPWILGDVEDGDQVAGRTVAGPGDAVSPHGEVVMVGDARGDVDLELLVGADASVALTLRTGLLDHRALPRAAGARRHGHELSEHGARGPAHFARSGAGAAARGLGAGPRPGAPLEPRFTIAVVRGAPLGVPQDLIGFGDLFELRFGGVLLPRRDAVGMVLHREAAVGLLDLGLVRVALDPQDGVVIAFH